MKKILTFFAAVVLAAAFQQVCAQDPSWIGKSYIIANGSWYHGSGDGNPAFEGADLGTITDLKLGGQVQDYGNNDGAKNPASLFYKIDNGSWQSFKLAWFTYKDNNNWYGIESDASKAQAIDISGLQAGKHTIAVYFKACNSQYDSNDSKNYNATFTTAASSPIVKEIRIFGTKYVADTLTFASSIIGFSGAPEITYSIKQGTDEYAALDSNVYVPQQTGEYTVKAEAQYQTEKAFKETTFMVIAKPALLDLTIIQDVLWSSDEAKIAAWIWGKDLEGEWTAFATNVNDTLTLKVNDKADSIIFVRNKPELESPSWDAWNRIDAGKIAECRRFIITDWKEGSWCERSCKNEYGLLVNGKYQAAKINPDQTGSTEYMVLGVVLNQGDSVQLYDKCAQTGWADGVEYMENSYEFERKNNKFVVNETNNYDFYFQLGSPDKLYVGTTTVYAKNSWCRAEWSWKPMMKIGQDSFLLDSVFFGGVGVNINVATKDEGAVWFDMQKMKYTADTIQESDMVSLLFNGQDSSLTATLLRRDPLIQTSPAVLTSGYAGPVTIIFNPNKGNKGMVGADKCYAYTGITIDGKDWQCAGTWLGTGDRYRMAKNDKTGNWELVMPNGMYAFYSQYPSPHASKLSFVFHNGNAEDFKIGKTAEDGDIEIPIEVGRLRAFIETRVGDVVEQNSEYSLVCSAVKPAGLTLSLGNVKLDSIKDSTNMTVPVKFETMGKDTLKLFAIAGEEVDSVEWPIQVIPATKDSVRPEGTKMGVTYLKNPDGTNSQVVRFCTYAAACKTPNDEKNLEPARAVYVMGTFKNNNWKLNEKYRMYRDGNYFWIDIDKLTYDIGYNYQYAVVRSDGKMVKISDLYSTRITEKAKGADGYASYFEILSGKKTKPYEWSEATLNFKNNRPDKNNLVIYELWVYDHAKGRNFKSLMSRMDYFTELGVNCIELMPVNEFDGDKSWGYAPNHYFALDNQYGTMNEFKVFVDSCHGRGIAVVLDVVLNHSTGNNPMAKLYPKRDEYDELQYNPWYNVYAPHPDNVYEDWNHDFAPTHQMMKDVLAFWMDEYKVDGYRLDLSHGLCGKGYPNATGNLVDYYHSIVEPRGGYMMLEHWGNYPEDRPYLVSEGMMCWQNTSQVFLQTAMGWLSNDDMNAANQKNYVSYPENHDEERSMFAAKAWGAGNLQTSEEARAARVPLNLGFQCLLDGPQLFYHYTEQGMETGKYQDENGNVGKKEGNEYCAYDFPICDSAEYKMANKSPFLYKWTNDTAIHMNAMREVGKIIRLRTRYIPEAFVGKNPTDGALQSGYERRFIRWGNDVLAVGNFSATNDVTCSNQDLLTGVEWYDYLNGGTKALEYYTLKPGEIKVFTGRKISPDPTAVEKVWDSMAKNANVQKLILNGKMYIIRGDKMYDATGSLVR